eukprot:CAMPEP_0204619344 /NCGR_PEP_ID=MMETSP0717-20131115/5756_1 /ASSEMBLY_ACC=CAM_ASM_000666 /TAXON_ID=230516 /ORGANISM="Chaetoceros curvisetus" /LENGTH=58 /DNA_ID=CAMNT_0051633333 /DNA_START=472 /DNA_END=648 /DNA_ORIENTATION=-
MMKDWVVIRWWYTIANSRHSFLRTKLIKSSLACGFAIMPFEKKSKVLIGEMSHANFED